MNVHSPLSSLFFPFFTALFLLFLYVPIAVLVIFSFNDNAISYAWSGFTLRWYGALCCAAPLWAALGTSFLVAICTVIATITMSVLAVYCGVRQYLEKFLSLFYVNLAVPEVVLAVGLLSFFYFFSFDFGFVSLVVSHTVLGLGYAVPIIAVRFHALDKRLIEASLDLGASQLQTFFYVVLPFLRPALLTAALLVFVISFDNFIISFFCAGSSLQTFPLHIFSIIRSGGGSPIINALSTLLLCVSGLGLVLGIMMQKRWSNH